MVLLSSSTISVAISSSIVGLFTLLLFLSGYVLQQQSVRNIQAALRPSIPINYPMVETVPSPRWSGGGSISDLLKDKEKWKSSKKSAPDRPNLQQVAIDTPRNNAPHQETSTTTTDTPYKKQAYLQVLSKPSTSDVCSVLNLFATLAANGTLPTDQIIIYPESWDTRSPTKSLSSALRLLKETSTKYNTVIHTVDTTRIPDRSPAASHLLRKASPSLSQYERILYLRSPGLVVDTTRLESLFTSNSGLEDGNSNEQDVDIDMHKQVWTPVRLSTVQRQLPSAFLVTSTPRVKDPSALISGDLISISSYALNPVSLDTTNYVVASGSAPASFRYAPDSSPAYVYFDKDVDRRRGKGDVRYMNWKEKLQSVCKGIDLGI